MTHANARLAALGRCLIIVIWPDATVRSVNISGGDHGHCDSLVSITGGSVGTVRVRDVHGHHNRALLEATVAAELQLSA